LLPSTYTTLGSLGIKKEKVMAVAVRAHSWSAVRRILSVLFVLGTTEGIVAAAPSGNEMLQQCSAAIRQADGERLNEQDSVASLMCLSYLEGFLDSHAFDLVRLPSPLYCLPQKEFTVGQFARMVVRTLKESPEKLHENARLAVGLTLVRGFPCAK
jgi:hypothetical protein